MPKTEMLETYLELARKRASQKGIQPRPSPGRNFIRASATL